MKCCELIHKNPVLSVLIVAIACGLVGVVLSKVLPSKHEASIAFTIDHRELQASEDYAFDGYYALRASEIFADTVVSWFNTPSVHARILELARGFIETELPESLNFRVKKFSSQNVVATLKDRDAERLEHLAQTTVGVITSRASELNKNADGNSIFVVSAEKPIIYAKALPPAKAGIIGFLLGAVIAGLALILLTPPKKG